MARHLHLDLLGGLSGDMFIGGMLDTFPELKPELAGVIARAGFPDLAAPQIRDHNDGTLTGVRFSVVAKQEAHRHRHYAQIRETLSASDLPPETGTGALDIFRLIAEVEAEIHGKNIEEVAFHEVGAWDSIADVVLAAHLIACVRAGSWSVSAVPLGGGRVATAHGHLPVPAPATLKLLQGFEVVDDGIEGERVTPTGAAILKYLNPARSVPEGYSIRAAGYGFGARVLPGIANTVRVCDYARVGAGGVWAEDQVMRLSFELDDQTPESIAGALEQLRGEAGVLDVTQQPCWGKKNRQGFTITLLTLPAVADRVTARCFSLTTTLGIRRERVTRAVLNREEVVVYVGERPYRVKVARRPEGYTAKVEMDDLTAAGEQREQIRRQAEALAIGQAERR